MKYPSPENLERAPIWENYIVAQAVQASLGLIPAQALAVGVEITERQVRLQFQLTEVSEQDAADMGDIASELESLVGPDIEVEKVYEIREWRAISPHDGVRWIFLKRW